MNADQCNLVCMATNVLKCPLCGSPSLTFKLYVSHLRLVHSKDSSFKIMCGVDGCREVFRAFSAFSSHIYRHHRPAILGGSSSEPTCSSNETPGSSLQEEDSAGHIEEDPLPGICAAQKVDSSKHSQTVAAARFVLQLREGHQISQAAISDVTAGCKSLCKQAADEIKEGVKATLTSAGINCESIPGLLNALDSDANPFQSIDSNYLFEKFCSEHLGYLVS